MVGAVLGIVQAGIGIAGLASSEKDKDKGIPQEAPELRSAYQRALEQSKYGFDAQQKAAFDQKLASEGNAAYRKGVDMGGGSLSAAVSAGINSMRLNARNEFAMNDASLKMQKQAPVYSLAGQIQGQDNLKSNYYNQQYNAQQQAYGGALKAGTESLGNAIKQQQYMGFMKDMYGQNGGVNPQGNAPQTEGDGALPDNITLGAQGTTIGSGGIQTAQAPMMGIGYENDYMGLGGNTPQIQGAPIWNNIEPQYMNIGNFNYGGYGSLQQPPIYGMPSNQFPTFGSPSYFK